jgi:glutamate synthase domain-containing protein 2
MLISEKMITAWHWRLTPVNLATQEPEIRKITVQSQSQIV